MLCRPAVSGCVGFQHRTRAIDRLSRAVSILPHNGLLTGSLVPCRHPNPFASSTGHHRAASTSMYIIALLTGSLVPCQLSRVLMRCRPAITGCVDFPLQLLQQSIVVCCVKFQSLLLRRACVNKTHPHLNTLHRLQVPRSCRPASRCCVVQPCIDALIPTAGLPLQLCRP